MALTTIYFMDGFDHYVTADLPKKYTSGIGTILAAAGRQGTNAWRLFNNAFQVRSITGVSTLSMAMAVINIDGSAGTIMQMRNSGTVHVDLRWNADHSLSPRLAGSTVLGTTTPLSNAIYYHIEMKVVVHDTAGSVQIWVNEVLRLNLTDVDTRNGATTTINEAVLGGNGADLRIDDLHVGDDQIGDRHIRTKFADAAGNYSEWTPSAGSNYQNVDESAPDGDTTTVAAPTANQRDTYGFQDAAGGESIIAVAVNFVAKKTDAGTCTIAPLLRHSSTDYVGTDVFPSDTSYANFQQIYMQHPSAVAWTPSNMNATEFGVKRTT